MDGMGRGSQPLQVGCDSSAVASWAATPMAHSPGICSRPALKLESETRCRQAARAPSEDAREDPLPPSWLLWLL